MKRIRITLRKQFAVSHRAPGVNSSSVDIRDWSRETEEGNTSGQGLGQLKRLKKEEETEG